MKENGGPAFPQQMFTNKDSGSYETADEYGHGGMTLRQYFAAKAMQSMIQRSATPFVVSKSDQKLISLISYQIADEMITESDRA